MQLVVVAKSPTPDGADEEPVDVMAPAKDKRSAAVPAWAYKVRWLTVRRS